MAQFDVGGWFHSNESDDLTHCSRQITDINAIKVHYTHISWNDGTWNPLSDCIDRVKRGLWRYEPPWPSTVRLPEGI